MDVIDEIRKIIDGQGEKNEKLLKICKILHENFKHFNWVGFYFADREKRELILGPFVGEPTEHVRIKFGDGICGQAAQAGKTFIVQDVSKEKNYLSCSPKVKAEIVIPIFKNGEVVAELDIDSHFLSSFTDDDKKLLEKIAKMVGEML